MAFLNALKDFDSKKLAKTETTITTADGRKLKEKKSEDGVYDAEAHEDGDAAAGFVVDTKPDPGLHKVVDRLYIGSQDAAVNREGLEQEGVTHILNVASGIPNAFPDDFKYLSCEILDHDQEDIVTHFEETSAFIAQGTEEGSAVLVHCNAGVSRSATVIIAYLMAERGLGLDEALATVKEAREQIRPNDGFMKQLKEYEETLAAAATEATTGTA